MCQYKTLNFMPVITNP